MKITWDLMDLLAPVTEVLPVGIVAVERDGTILRWNSHAEAMLEATPDDLRGSKLQELALRPDDLVGAVAVSDLVNGGGSWEGEFTAVTARGTEIEVHAVQVPIWDDDTVTGRLIVAFDVKAYRDRLISGLRALQQASVSTVLDSEARRWQASRQMNEELLGTLNALRSDLLWESPDEDPVIARDRRLTMLDRAIADTSSVSAVLTPPELNQLGLRTWLTVSLRWTADAIGARAEAELGDTPPLSEAAQSKCAAFVTKTLAHIERSSLGTSVVRVELHMLHDPLDPEVPDWLEIRVMHDGTTVGDDGVEIEGLLDRVTALRGRIGGPEDMDGMTGWHLRLPADAAFPGPRTNRPRTADG